MAKGESSSGCIQGKLLRVDLTESTWKIEEIPRHILKYAVGGRGLGVKILSDELDPLVEPISKENILVIATGPLTGTTAPTGCRYEVITKSPLTGTITSANAGGKFGVMLKKAGLDAIIIEGSAKKPLYLLINDDKIKLMDAERLWGKNTHETTDFIKNETKIQDISVACIGPAGEKLVRFASIINDKHRAAGRGGVGAVLGAKKLKAIALFGSKKIKILDKKKFQDRIKKILEKIKTTTVTNINLPEYGTAKIMDAANNYMLLGTRNFQLNYFEDAKKINAKQLKNKLLVSKTSCWGCPIACKRVTQVEGKSGEGPEFETLWSFGAQCGVSDLKAIAKANYLCNELGLDTISTGNTIGCAMELSEKGIIPKKISFGDANIIQELTKAIAFREGPGISLAEGSYRFARSVGHPEFSMSVKKQELPAYDPRCGQAQGLGYATSTRGACHVRAFVVKSDMVAGKQKTDHETINIKTKAVIKSQNLMAVVDSLGMCMFSSFVCEIDDYWVLLERGSGIGFKDPDELLKAGERIWTLETMFNQNAGFTRNDDKLPKRFTHEQVEDSLGHEHVWPETELLDDYYQERGWTANGVPTKKKLKELGI